MASACKFDLRFSLLAMNSVLVSISVLASVAAAAADAGAGAGAELGMSALKVQHHLCVENTYFLKCANILFLYHTACLLVLVRRA